MSRQRALVISCLSVALAAAGCSSGAGAGAGASGGAKGSGGVNGNGSGGANASDFDGTAWTVKTTFAQPARSMFGFAPNDIYFGLADGHVVHHTGGNTTWAQTKPLPPPFASANLVGAWIADNGDRFVAGIGTSANSPTLLSAHGPTGWQPATVTGFAQFTNLWGVWSASPTDVWAGGDLSNLIHYDGSSWTFQPTTNTVTRIDAIGGDATRDIYAVGAAGTILQYGD